MPCTSCAAQQITNTFYIERRFCAKTKIIQFNSVQMKMLQCQFIGINVQIQLHIFYAIILLFCKQNLDAFISLQ